MNSLIPLLTALLSLLTSKAVTNPDYSRRNLRIVKRTYKQFKKEFKKDGFTPLEQTILDKLEKEIIERTINLKK